MIKAGLVLALPAGATLQTSAQRPVKLYVSTAELSRAETPHRCSSGGVTTTDMSVAIYLVVHPRGTLLWDAGVIPDERIQPGGTTDFRATVKKTLKGQLEEIGYKPSDITYFALSHNHYDHSANANAFAGSTWLVQKRSATRCSQLPSVPRRPTARVSRRSTPLRGIEGQQDDAPERRP